MSNSPSPDYVSGFNRALSLVIAELDGHLIDKLSKRDLARTIARFNAVFAFVPETAEALVAAPAPVAAVAGPSLLQGVSTAPAVTNSAPPKNTTRKARKDSTNG